MTTDKDAVLARIMTERGIDIDMLKTTITDDEAVDRLWHFIQTGRMGWADPVLLASLERVYDMVKGDRP